MGGDPSDLDQVVPEPAGWIEGSGTSPTRPCVRTEATCTTPFVEDEAEKEALLASDPAKFFTTPHYDGHPIVLVHLEAVGVDELTELIADAWRVKAPPRVRKLHEHELPG